MRAINSANFVWPLLFSEGRAQADCKTIVFCRFLNPFGTYLLRKLPPPSALLQIQGIYKLLVDDDTLTHNHTLLVAIKPIHVHLDIIIQNYLGKISFLRVILGGRAHEGVPGALSVRASISTIASSGSVSSLSVW